MGRLIDEDTLCQTFDTEIASMNEKEMELYKKGLRLAKYICGYMPTVDAVPVVHAYWAEDTETGNVACSNCGCILMKPLSKYCPNCGARMDGEGDT